MGLFDRLLGKAPPRPPEFTLSIAGYGIEARPKLPVNVAHLEKGTLIFGPSVGEAKARAAHGQELQNLFVSPGNPPRGPLAKRRLPGTELSIYSTGEEGTTSLALGRGQESYDSILDDLRTAPHPAHWTLLMRDHAIQWPAGFSLFSKGDQRPGGWPYELTLGGSADEFLRLVGPYGSAKGIPAPERFIAPGMEMIEEGDLDGTVNTVCYFTLAYEHDGEPWRQFIFYLPLDEDSVYVLRSQARLERHDRVFEASVMVAATFRPHP